MLKLTIMTHMKQVSPKSVLLTSNEVAQLLRDAQGWSLQHGKLTRSWIFADFLQAMAFVSSAADLAEQANHHPDIDIRYNRVTLALHSHDVGGLTQRDAKLVLRINERFPA